MSNEPYTYEDDDLTDGSMAVYRYISGKEFAFETSVHNGGSRSVTVTGFPGLEDLFYATRTGIDVEDDPGPYHGGTPQSYEPFSPFNLDPGEERVVRYNYRFRESCVMEFPKRMNPRWFDGGTVVDSFDVEFEYLGISRRAEIPLSTVIGVEATGECPLN